MHSLLIVSFSPIQRDPRVLRQIQELRNDFKLTVAGYGPFFFEGVTCLPLDVPTRGVAAKAGLAGNLTLRRYRSTYWELNPAVHQLQQLLGDESFDILLANDIDALPVILAIANGVPTVADLHEYALDEGGSWRARRLLGPYKEWLCDSYLTRATRTITVSPGIASAYANRYPGVRPVVVANAPKFQGLKPSTMRPGLIRLIHHGSGAEGRGLEQLVDMASELAPRFELNFMLVENQAGFLAELTNRAKGASNIRFLSPVPTEGICTAINSFDAGVHLLPPTSFNNIHALPNKFFEFVQARLGVVIGPSPEMARYVEQFQIGAVAKSFSPGDMADALNGTSDDQFLEWKHASDAAARELSWERYAATLRQTLAEAVNA